MALIIEKQIDRYIELSRISLEEYIGISKRSQGDKEAIIKHRLQKKSSFILSAQFGLFQVFDVLYKLEQQKEL